MPYHEFTTRGRLHRRSNAVCGHFSGYYGIDPNSELGKLARQLKGLIGPEGFYQWASELPAGIVGPGARYEQAIQDKLAELGRAPQPPTQLFLLRLSEEQSSADSVAQESAGVTILDEIT